MVEKWQKKKNENPKSHTCHSSNILTLSTHWIVNKMTQSAINSLNLATLSQCDEHCWVRGWRKVEHFSGVFLIVVGEKKRRFIFRVIRWNFFIFIHHIFALIFDFSIVFPLLLAPWNFLILYPVSSPPPSNSISLSKFSSFILFFSATAN